MPFVCKRHEVNFISACVLYGFNQLFCAAEGHFCAIGAVKRNVGVLFAVEYVNGDIL